MAQKTKMVKFLTAAELSKYSRHVNPKAVTFCPIIQHILHGGEVRCTVAITEGAQVQITMPLNKFNQLPMKEV